MQMLRPILTGLLAALTSPLYAQLVAELNPVVVSARGYSQLASETLSSVTIFDRDEIDRVQARGLVDLLVGEPGFEFGRNGGQGTTTSIFLRGADSKNILVLIDGVRAHTDNIGSINLTDIPLDHVERVELLRGNASALYGEAAIGGVISIKTRDGYAGPPKAYGSLSLGARNTQGLSAGFGGSVHESTFNVIASTFQTDGFSAKSALNSNLDKDGYRRQAFSGMFKRKFSTATEVGIQTNVVRGKTDYDAFSLTDQDVFESDTEVFSAYLKVSANDQITSTLEMSRSSLTYKDLRNGNLRSADDFIDGLQKGESTTYSLSNVLELDKTSTLTFGLSFTDARYDLLGYTNAINYRESLGYFIGFDKAIDRLGLQASIRRDELDAGRVGGVSHKYDEISYLVGLGYTLSGPYRLTATHSVGFRAPAPAEFLGTPTLRPELSKTSEYGLEYRKDQAVFRVIYFDTSSKDAIYYDPNVFSFGNQNVDNRGLEASGKMLFEGYQVKVAYTRQNPVNTSLDIQQARRAKSFGSVDLQRESGMFSWGIKAIWSGTRRDSDFSDRQLSSYTTANVYLARKLSPEWTSRLLFENITNERYEIAGGYNTPPRGVFLSFLYRAN
ncbi:MAG: TonB-dependent receptor plug domain-containing protein [Burkholderiaceae bacterium]